MLARKKRNITQGELAKKVSTSNGQICRIENGTVMPKADLLYNIAKVLGTTMEQLMGVDKLKGMDEADETDDADPKI